MEYEMYRERLLTMQREIGKRILLSESAVEPVFYSCADYKEGNACPAVTEGNFTLFAREDLWGGEPDRHAWFYARVKIPEAREGVRLELRVRTDVSENGWDASNPQFIAYIDGRAVQGMDIHHTALLLPTDRSEIDLHIYAYTGTNLQPSTPLKLYIDICEIDEECEKLYYDLSVPYDILMLSRENSREYAEILNYLSKAIDLLDWRTDSALRASYCRASDYLEKEFYGKYCAKGDVKVKCIGHTHIDIAWLWSVRQTREKAQRSFFTVLELMRRYPEYKFMSSQVPLYLAIKEEAPDKYEEIKERIKEGRWEAEGAMWVEPDCNLTSGESLVRQVLYGKRFYKEEFGIDSRLLWLPDVFGYSAALPQILKKSGVDKFVTSKISWNDRNTLPTDTFMWKGIDGTEIFTYFMTAQKMRTDDKIENFTTYCPEGNASYVMGSWRRYQNKDLTDKSMLTYGWGDGGGGPTSSDIEMLRRMEKGIPGCPTTEFSSATDFLNEVERDAGENIEKWVGELYFEFHRGTYTSQAKVKKNNRKAEFALHNLELVATVCSEISGTEYPKAQLTEMWKKVLTNQFHDILPGSSIREVYEVANREYEEVIAECEEMTKALLSSLAEGRGSGGLLLFNPTSFTMGGTVSICGETRYVENIPALGYRFAEPVPKNRSISHGENRMENDFFAVEFDGNFEICRLYDKRNCREVLPAGKSANRLVLFEDFTADFDAWELRRAYGRKSYPLTNITSAEWIEDGERCGFKLIRETERSLIEQTVWLYEHIARIDVDNRIDWHEKHHVLRAFFPVDVNAEKATFDIQFGNYERSTHENTSWQQAQFEVCAQKFADLSDSGCGMAVLNDCKYGYSVKNGEIGLTLLRAPTYPDRECDMGVHTFTYSLYPHSDDLRHSDVYKEAYRLNNPLIVIPSAGGRERAEYSFASSDKDNVIIETVKHIEDGDGTVIRLFESMNRQTNVTLNFGSEIREARLCNLLEEEICKLNITNNSINLTVSPFEIITVALKQ